MERIRINRNAIEIIKRDDAGDAADGISETGGVCFLRFTDTLNMHQDGWTHEAIPLSKKNATEIVMLYINMYEGIRKGRHSLEDFRNCVKGLGR